MRRRCVLGLVPFGFLLATALTSWAQSSAEKVSLETLAAVSARAGETVTLTVTVNVKPGWHIQSPKKADEFVIATRLEMEPASGLRFDAVQYPPVKKIKMAGESLDVLDGKVRITQPVTIAQDALPGKRALRGKLELQACDDQTCIMPATLEVTIPLEITGAPAASSSSGVSGPERAPPSTTNAVESLIRQRGWWVALAIVFGWGLALNLTPCVYPMITITVSYFGSQGEHRSLRSWSKALVYFAGIVLSYATLGLVAGLTGSLFGAALQSPVVLVLIGVLLVALSLSLFGLYELQPPSFLVQKAAGLSGKAGYAGVFLLGGTVGVIAAPCLAPVVVAVLAFIAQSGDPWIGWWLFFTLGAGLGAPYVVLAMFSGLLQRLPRSGQWMVRVKIIFGVALLLVALWITNPVWGRFLRPPEDVSLKKLAAEIAHATDEKRPVLLDFYADWCLPCREMDKLTLPDPRVQERLRQFAFVKVDLTRSDSPSVRELQRHYRVVGVPAYVFLDREGRERVDLRRAGFVPAQDFVALLDRALSDKP